MVIIRLARHGRKKAPFYRVVATDSTKKTNGPALEMLGYWNPSTKLLKLEKENMKKWQNKGAQISPAVKKLLEI